MLFVFACSYGNKAWSRTDVHQFMSMVERFNSVELDTLTILLFEQSYLKLVYFFLFYLDEQVEIKWNTFSMMRPWDRNYVFCVYSQYILKGYLWN